MFSNSFFQILLQSHLIPSINFEAFGVGATLFILLIVWLKMTMKEKEKMELKINKYEEDKLKIVEKLTESEKSTITLLNDFNNLISSIQRDLRETNIKNYSFLKTENKELFLKIQEIIHILNIINRERNNN
jgi:hypothetical protein